MALAPKLYPAGLADRNSNSAYEKLKFIEEHYEELMQAYQVIMEHLKIVNESSQVELPDDLVTYDSDNNVLKSGENTIQISADVPDNIVTYVPMNDREEVLDNTDGSINNSWNSYLAELQYPNNTPTEMGTTQVYGISFTEPYLSENALTYNLPVHPVGLVNAYTDLYYLTCNGEILLNLSDVITTGNFENTLANYSSNFLTSSDLPDLSGYVETSEVANEAGKIPRYNSQGHLVLPDGTEIWCENE